MCIRDRDWQFLNALQDGNELSDKFRGRVSTVKTGLEDLHPLFLKFGGLLRHAGRLILPTVAGKQFQKDLDQARTMEFKCRYRVFIFQEISQLLQGILQVFVPGYLLLASLLRLTQLPGSHASRQGNVVPVVLVGVVLLHQLLFCLLYTSPSPRD